MSLRRFLPYSLIGTLVWATAFTLAGYAFHESFETAAGALTHAALALAVLAAVAVAVKTVRGHQRRGSLRSGSRVERWIPVRERD